MGTSQRVANSKGVRDRVPYRVGTLKTHQTLTWVYLCPVGNRSQGHTSCPDHITLGVAIAVMCGAGAGWADVTASIADSSGVHGCMCKAGDGNESKGTYNGTVHIKTKYDCHLYFLPFVHARMTPNVVSKKKAGGLGWRRYALGGEDTSASTNTR